MRVRLVSGSHFSAAHRLHRDDWDAETNRRVFDKCNNEHDPVPLPELLAGKARELRRAFELGRLIRQEKSSDRGFEPTILTTSLRNSFLFFRRNRP